MIYCYLVVKGHDGMFGSLSVSVVLNWEEDDFHPHQGHLAVCGDIFGCYTVVWCY
jgi:hypothetical protein